MCLVSSLQVCLYTICRPTEVRRGHGICTNGGMDGCEPPCRYWELNLCPLQEDLVLLTAEPPLRTKLTLLKKPSLSVLSFTISAFVIISKKPK